METPIDSTKIQIRSLTQFANALGYKLSPLNYFYNVWQSGNEGRKVVSVNTMVMLHNTNCENDYIRWGSVKPNYIWNLKCGLVENAIKQKLVSMVYIQHKRKGNLLLVHKDWVKFVNGNTEQLLGQ